MKGNERNCCDFLRLVPSFCNLNLSFKVAARNIKTKRERDGLVYIHAPIELSAMIPFVSIPDNPRKQGNGAHDGT